MQFTQQIVALDKSLNIAVYDHLTIDRQGFACFRSDLMQQPYACKKLYKSVEWTDYSALAAVAN